VGFSQEGLSIFVEADDGRAMRVVENVEACHQHSR
jgi:hypothetical protein